MKLLAKLSTRNLFDSWSERGHWWSSRLDYASGAALRVSGELRVDGLRSEMSLDVMGAAYDLRSPPGHDSFNLSDEWPPDAWIHGLTQNGVQVSLAGPQVGASSFKSISHLANKVEILPNWIIVGGWIDQESTFCEATFEFPGLAAFLEHAFKTQNASNLACSKHEFTIYAVFLSKPFSITFWQENDHGKWSAGAQDPGPQPRSGITISPFERQDMDWFFQISYSLQYFMTVLYGVPTCPSCFTLGDLEVFYKFSRQRINQAPKWTEMIIRCVGDQTFRDAVKKWFGYGDAYKEATYRFFEAFYFPHHKTNVDLVLYSQTLEVLHNVVSPSKSRLNATQKTAFKGIKKWIKKVYPRDPSLTNEILGRLAYTGYPSQKDRLIELFKELDGYIPNLFYVDPTDFIQAIVLTRNFYIHGTKNQIFLDLVQQYAAVRGLELSVILLFLKDLGFTNGQVNHGLAKTNLWRRWSFAKAHYLTY